MKLKIFFMLLLGISFNVAHAEDGEITTAGILRYTTEALMKNPFKNCLNYEVVGTCFWLDCSGLKCGIKTTLKVRQYLPDVVISVFPDRKKNPWKEIRLLDRGSFELGDKLLRAELREVPSHVEIDASHMETSDQTPDVKFMEATVIGNPALTIAKGSLFLEGQAIPFKPYLHSGLDAIVWRDAQKEILEFLFLLNEIIPVLRG